MINWKDASISQQSVALNLLKCGLIEKPMFLQEQTLEDLGMAVTGTYAQNYLNDSIRFYSVSDVRAKREFEFMEILYIGCKDVQYAFLLLMELILTIEEVDCMLEED